MDLQGSEISRIYLGCEISRICRLYTKISRICPPDPFPAQFTPKHLASSPGAHDTHGRPHASVSVGLGVAADVHRVRE